MLCSRKLCKWMKNVCDGSGGIYSGVSSLEERIDE
jgi:hypothetical protein